MARKQNLGDLIFCRRENRVVVLTAPLRAPRKATCRVPEDTVVICVGYSILFRENDKEDIRMSAGDSAFLKCPHTVVCVA